MEQVRITDDLFCEMDQLVENLRKHFVASWLKDGIRWRDIEKDLLRIVELDLFLSQQSEL